MQLKSHKKTDAQQKGGMVRVGERGMYRMSKYLFGERFRILREKIGVTQAEMAQKLGVVRQIIGYYENGTRVPDIQFLQRIVDVTGCSAAYLLGNEDSMVSRHAYTSEITGLDDDTIDQIERHLLLSQTLNVLFKNEQFWTMISILDLYSKCKTQGRYKEFIDYLQFVVHSNLRNVIEDMANEKMPSQIYELQNLHDGEKIKVDFDDIDNKESMFRLNEDILSQIHFEGSTGSAEIRKEELKVKNDRTGDKFDIFRNNLLYGENHDDVQ